MQVTQGIYKHYKSTPENPRYYQVLFLSHLEDTLEVMVNYQPLYYDIANKMHDDGITVWTRTLSSFCDIIEWNGKKVPRFKKVTAI